MAPTEVSFALSGYAGCPLATRSPRGQVLLGRSDRDDVAFDVYSADGAQQGRITDMTGWFALQYRPDESTWFSWTTDGYIGIAGTPPQITVRSGSCCGDRFPADSRRATMAPGRTRLRRARPR